MTSLHGFELLREEMIAELKTKARIYRHVKSGAELLSLENDDENKVFGINFRTLPSDSTGVAHIMEHSVLCGSEKYPVKEAFIELAKGSLNTFLNAFTFPDKTCYPIASQNVQDFYNLIDVYMHAVLHPLLPPHILDQEGWHYELDEIESPLHFKGVVFNEMKGAYSSPDGLLREYTQRTLFPDTLYAFDSGGDPVCIPDLTYEQFKQFHEQYYHPSNARIFFYGDDDPKARLRAMDGYLNEFEALPTTSNGGVGLQQFFEQPRKVTHTYPADEEAVAGKKSMLVVSWLLPEVAETEIALTLGALSHVLIATPASPLRKALIDSGLGEDIAGVGLEEDLRQMYFSTGLKGIAAGDADRVEALVLETLERLVREGIDPNQIEASLNTIEFQLRENNTGRWPRGLILMIRALRTWLHDSDPLGPLAFEAPLAALKEKLAADPNYFSQLIERYFLQNTHRVTLALVPDAEQAGRMAADERERLDAARDGMLPDELQAVLENTVELKRIQETPDSLEALATIPVLTLGDLDKENKRIPVEVLEKQGVAVLYHDLFTNGIVYFDLGFDLHGLAQEDLPYAGLFGSALLEMGTDEEDFVALSQRIGRKTGGIWSDTLISARHDGEGEVALLVLRGKAMLDQAGELLAILRDVLRGVKLDNQERLRQIVLEHKATQEAILIPSGHRVVNTRIRSQFGGAGWVNEQVGGIAYLQALRDLAGRIDSDWPGVLAQLERIRNCLVNRALALGNVTVDAAGWAQFAPQLDAFLAGLPVREVTRAEWMPSDGTEAEGLTIPAQVNYVAKGANLYDLGYKLHGSVLAINNYVNTTWLWERVRVHGGAYGGFGLFDRRSGVYAWLSYRDPNLLETLAIYDETGAFLQSVELSDEEVVKSIIGAIGEMDAYQLPDAKGYTSMMRHLIGETDTHRQQLRDQLLAATAADFRAFGEMLAKAAQIGKVAVLGDAAKIETVNHEREGWMKVVKVM